MNKFAVFALVMCVAKLSCGSPVANDSNDVLKPFVIREGELIQKLNNKCAAKDVSGCVMLKLVTYMNKLMKKNSVEYGETIEIAKKDNAQVEEEQTVEIVQLDSGRSLSDESVFSEIMADKLTRFVKSRSLKVKIMPEADFVVSTADQDSTLNFGLSIKTGETETGRGKNKNMGQMMGLIMMKLGMLKIFAFKALALLVGKALLVSKLAFLLATLLGLKKLFSQQKHVTYEVVAHPHHESHGDSYSSGWGRSSLETAHNLAYGGQAQ